MKDDPTIARIRAARRAISTECGHDAKRLVERYIRLQEKHKGQLLQPRPAGK
jgi:hypothetical protein